MPSVTVIIPVFNQWKLTRDCLKSLAAASSGHVVEPRVTVVDNGSTDETAEACPALGRDLFGDAFRFLRFAENRNFGPACNAAARQADTDLLLFLNNDTLPAPGWLPPLLATMEENPNLAGTGPLLTYADGMVQHLGIAFWPAGETLGHYLRHLPQDHPLARKRRSFRALTAAALLLERRRFLEVNGFCEEYVNGFEDVDLCLRLTADGGRMTVTPESRVIHLESQTPNRHAGESHNSEVLRRRCDLAACADLDILAGRDGYTLKVEPDLHALVATPDARALTLLRRANAPGENRQKILCRLLEEDPLWEEGYLLLASLLEKRGAFLDALLVSLRGGNLVPTLRLKENSLRLSARAGVELADLAGQVADTRSRLRDRARNRLLLRKMIDTMRTNGRAHLIPLFERAAREADALRPPLPDDGAKPAPAID